VSEKLIVGFTPRGAREVEEAKRWWRTNREKAPAAMEEELTKTLDLIAAAPNIGVVARKSSLAGVRRILLGRVNYYLYYRPKVESGVIEVVAFWHAKRGGAPRL
jgi:plasmid stabilization system protein ParE